MSEDSTSLNEILGRDATRTIPDQIMDELCELINEETGLSLDKKKYRMRLRRKIKRQMRKRDINDPEEYIQRVRDDSGKELRALIEVVVVNETLVYRYPHQMRWLNQSFFPDLLESPPDTLRILSAGCSTGAEPYSAAIALAESLRQRGISPDDVPFNVKIVGIDISEDALAQAREGVYGRRPVQNAPGDVQGRYFERINNREYEVHPTLQNWTEFRKGNLLDCSLPPDNDLVLIRNVLIYFEEDERRKILRRLYHKMSRRASLIVGHAEDLSNYTQWFRSRENAPQGIYERWSTHRKTSPETGLKNSGRTERSRRKEAPEPDISVYRSGSDRVRLTLEGVVGENIRSKRFRDILEDTLGNSCGEARKCEIDLQNVRHFSNDHFGVLQSILKKCLSSGCEISVNSSDDDLGEELETLMDSPWFEVVPSLENPSTEETDGTYDEIAFDSLNGTEESGSGNEKTIKSEPSSPDLGELAPSDDEDQPNVDLQVLPEGLLFQLSGDWSKEQHPRELSVLLRHWIEEHQPDHVRILLTDMQGCDPGVVNVLQRLHSIDEEMNEALDVITDDSSLATCLRGAEIPVRFESSIEEIVD